MAPEDWADAEDAGRILAVVHSHPDAPAQPSEADRASCEATGLPWVIVSVREGQFEELHQFAPTGWQAPLLGRQFFHGVLDCYTLVRDWYRREAGSSCRTLSVPTTGGTRARTSICSSCAGRLLAFPMRRRSAGDVVLMAVRSPVANHAGIYLGSRRWPRPLVCTPFPTPCCSTSMGAVRARGLWRLLAGMHAGRGPSQGHGS
jgi:cell wall-associated NlpC family hydrolase